MNHSLDRNSVQAGEPWACALCHARLWGDHGNRAREGWQAQERGYLAPAGITWKHWDVNPARLQNRVCFPTGPPPTVFATAERGYLRHRGCWGTPAHLGPGRAPGSHLSGQTCWTQAVSGRRLGTWPAGQLSRCLLPARPPGSCTARRPGELPLQSDPSDLRWRRNKRSQRSCCERPSFVLKN